MFIDKKLWEKLKENIDNLPTNFEMINEFK